MFVNLIYLATYNLQAFKNRIHRYLELRPIPEVSSSFHGSWVRRGVHRLHLFGATSSCTGIIRKNKIFFMIGPKA